MWGFCVLSNRAALDVIKRTAMVAGSAEQTLLRVRMLLDAYPHPESPFGLPQEITDYFARKPSVCLSLRTKIKKDAVRHLFESAQR
jgi:hypothetical protein